MLENILKTVMEIAVEENNRLLDEFEDTDYLQLELEEEGSVVRNKTKKEPTRYVRGSVRKIFG